jgi:hypothetical protein
MQGISDLLGQIASNFGWEQVPAMIMAYHKVFLVIILGFVLHWLPGAFKTNWTNRFIASPVYVKALISTLVVFVVYQSLSADLQPFIYFRF